MKLFVFVCFAIFASVFGVSKAPKGCFRAAALDHVQQIDGNIFNPSDENLKNEIEFNLEMYEKAGKLAKENVSFCFIFLVFFIFLPGTSFFGHFWNVFYERNTFVLWKLFFFFMFFAS